MVENNNQSSDQEYQAMQQMLSRDHKNSPQNDPSMQPQKQNSTGKTILIIVLGTFGIVIGVSFLLLMTCLAIMSS